MKNLLCIPLVILILFSSCGPSPDAALIGQEAQLQKDMIELHDLVMPKMGKVNQIRKQLAQFLKEERISDSLKTQISFVVENLEKADGDMMSWMNENAPYFGTLDKIRKEKTHEEIIQLLEKEKEVMEGIEQLTNKNIEEGEKLLNLLENQENN